MSLCMEASQQWVSALDDRDDANGMNSGAYACRTVGKQQQAPLRRRIREIDINDANDMQCRCAIPIKPGVQDLARNYNLLSRSRLILCH